MEYISNLVVWSSQTLHAISYMNVIFEAQAIYQCLQHWLIIEITHNFMLPMKDLTYRGLTQAVFLHLRLRHATLHHVEGETEEVERWDRVDLTVIDLILITHDAILTVKRDNGPPHLQNKTIRHCVIIKFGNVIVI